VSGRISRQRILLLIPLSAAVIAGLVVFKMTRRYEAPGDESAFDVRPAPHFQLEDTHSRMVRLKSYLGRSKLLIVFFDGSRGPDHSELLSRLRENYLEIHATGAIVLAISAARPSQNRYGANLEHLKIDATGSGTAEQDELRYPFMLLSDILDYAVHRQYEAFDERTGKPREAVFVVDRAGLIQHAHLGADQLGAAEKWIRELRQVR
jgi:peroxiredoxin